MDPQFKSENYQNLGGMNTKASPYITGPMQFLDISNMDFSVPGSLTKRQGSTQYTGATVSGRITGLYEYEKLSGASYLIVTANTNAYTVTSGGGFNAFNTGLANGSIFDFVTFVDTLFAANGTNFFKYNGASVSNYSLPEGITLAAGVTGIGGITGFFQYQYGYLNELGYQGPAGGIIGISAAGAFAIRLTGFTTPAGFGITAFTIYGTNANGNDFFGITSVPSGTTLVSLLSDEIGIEPVPTSLYFTLSPKYLSIYNNSLIMAGFSGMLASTFYFSDVGIPESVQPENNIEVRTNDGDIITGHYPYGGGLVIFKKKSFHYLTGDNPETYLLKEVSNQYGCLSNRAVIAFQDVLWFLDDKGIVEWNGANISIVSDAIEPIFLSMNLAAARENAEAVHDKLRNEIIFNIPVNGSEQNNVRVIYDYIVKAWAVRYGIDASTTTIAKREFSAPTVFYGSYTGSIFNYGASLFGDNGNGFTTSFQTRFLSDMGKSVTEQYRRLYLDSVPIAGATSPLTIEFMTDYGASTVLSRTMYQSIYQSRIDYGIPAKALSFRCTQFSATLPLRVNGFTVESRKQRDT